jgi:hypothetical protein
MVTKTIGSGGDYASYKDALASIYRVSLSDDYTFDLITDVNQGDNLGSYDIRPEGHTVRFTCSYNEAHKSDWQNWKKVTLTSTYGLLLNAGSNANVNNGKIALDYFYVVNQTPTSLTDYCVAVLCNSWPYYHIYGYTDVSNGYINGNNKAPYGLLWGGTNDEYQIHHIWNVKIWNCGYGIYVGPSDHNHTPATVENITVCNNSSSVIQIYLRAPIVGRNIVCIWTGSTGTHKDFYITDAGSYDVGPTVLRNTAVSDSTITTYVTSAYNCIENIVPANEFISLDDSNANFLKPKSTRGIVYGANNIGPNGIAPTLVSFDIVGKTYLDSNGKYPIGAHAPDYASKKAKIISVI